MAPKASVVERLDEARRSRTLLRITRTPRNADRIVGFVLGTGAKWVLVSEVRNGGYFDGLLAVRLEDIVKVRRDSTFSLRFARTQPDWPPAAPGAIDLDTTRGLIRDLSALSPLIGIEQERRYDEEMQWIGVVDEVAKGWLWLHEVGPDATWHEHPLGYKLKQITKVVVSDRYLAALASIAGTTPVA